jgi:asparagine synthase (glutamine-hydrolysing)
VCGITAALTARGSIDADVFRASTIALRHRGGDGEGVDILEPEHGDAAVALGHCRLSIFDLSAKGRQPMRGASRRWIVFNGSIFNWCELRGELEEFGYEFRTGTDTEVILAAYDRWGARCVERFNGFWALVIADPSARGGVELFLSRDRFGIKPLYVAQRGNRWFFASELCAVWRYFDERPALNLREAHRFLIHDLSHDSSSTLYAGIDELEPGCNATLRPPFERLDVQRYWSLRDVPRPMESSDAAVLERFGDLVEDAVRLRLRADREVALTLSGGIDSSVLAVAAARVCPSSVAAFTSSFPSYGKIDETTYAARVTSRLGIAQRRVDCEDFDLRAEEHRLTQHQELMYTSFSMLTHWNVAQRIREHGTRIFLTGQGGDELLLGYERYYGAFARHSFSRGLVAGWSALSMSARNSGLTLPKAVGQAAYFGSGTMRKLRYLLEARQLFSAEFISAFDDSPAALSADLHDLQRAEITGSQLRRLLRYDDRTAGAFGLEARPAFLDHRLVEFCFSLPWKFKIRDGWTKYVARQYLERHGLPEIAWRRRKLGYAAPTLAWSDRLLPDFADCTDLSSLRRVLRPALSVTHVAPRAKFRLLNLLSTAKTLNWA